MDAATKQQYLADTPPTVVRLEIVRPFFPFRVLLELKLSSGKS
jgi:hypothetical protein